MAQINHIQFGLRLEDGIIIDIVFTGNLSNADTEIGSKFTYTEFTFIQIIFMEFFSLGLESHIRFSSVQAPLPGLRLTPIYLRIIKRRNRSFPICI